LRSGTAQKPELLVAHKPQDYVRVVLGRTVAAGVSV
jgi:hypothetical protein